MVKIARGPSGELSSTAEPVDCNCDVVKGVIVGLLSYPGYG